MDTARLDGERDLTVLGPAHRVFTPPIRAAMSRSSQASASTGRHTLSTVLDVFKSCSCAGGGF